MVPAVVAVAVMRIVAVVSAVMRIVMAAVMAGVMAAMMPGVVASMMGIAGDGGRGESQARSGDRANAKTLESFHT